MSRVLDYQFDNIVTETDGVRTIKNAGTSGVANDVTMDTGQMLEFNGLEDIYESSDVVGTPSGGSFSLFATFGADINTSSAYPAIAGKGFLNGGVNGYGFTRSLDRLTFQVRTDAFYTSAESPVLINDNVIRRAIGLRDSTTNTTSIYMDKVLSTGDVLDIGTTFTNSEEFSIGSRRASTSDYFWEGYIGNVILVDKAITQADADYDFENPEAIINMVISGIDNINFSFSVADVLSCYALVEGLGNVSIKNLVTSGDVAMYNFPSDNTQWTNADLLNEGLQDTLLIKDVNGVPTTIANPNSLRFNL